MLSSLQRLSPLWAAFCAFLLRFGSDVDAFTPIFHVTILSSSSLMLRHNQQHPLAFGSGVGELPVSSSSSSSISLLRRNHPHQRQMYRRQRRLLGDTRLFSSLEKSQVTKKSVLVKDRTETKIEEKQKPEEMWRVVLHNDEVHTFNYVVRSLCKVVGILDRKAAFEICVVTHGSGKATITKTWKKQAEQFCLGLQRQGLTVSIAPDADFEGGHSGGSM